MRLKRLFTQFDILVRHVRSFLWSDLPPWKMGLSAAIGAAIAVTPTIGLQTILVTVIVSLVRGNRGLALIASGIANPWTMPLIYYLDFRVGAALMGGPAWSGLPERFSLGTMSGILIPVLLGSVIVGFALGSIVGIGVSVLCWLRGRTAERSRVPA
jgi:uncharacterized protein (DUF2062 family)